MYLGYSRQIVKKQTNTKFHEMETYRFRAVREGGGTDGEACRSEGVQTKRLDGERGGQTVMLDGEWGGQTQGLDEADSRFLQYCKGACSLQFPLFERNFQTCDQYKESQGY
jgi:hypothetical protein